MEELRAREIECEVNELRDVLVKFSEDYIVRSIREDREAR